MVAPQALRLIDRAFIPGEAQPFQALQNGRGELGLLAVHVRVFDAENEDAARVTREEPVVKRCACPAHVQVTRGRRRKTDSDVAHDLVARPRGTESDAALKVSGNSPC